VDFSSTYALNSPKRLERVGSAMCKLLFLFEKHTLDTDRRELRHGSALMSIEPQVFDLLEYLIRNRDRVVSKDDLLASVWRGRIVSDSTLASRISAARRAIGDNGERQRLIRTTIGRGMRFTATVSEEVAPAVVVSSKQLPWSGIPRKKWAIAGKNWTIEGRYVEYCSCDVACPCFSMGEPSSGHCTGLFAFKIDNGCCEAVRLDDLAVAVTFYFPQAPLHYGQGVLQPFIDERADQDQRDALLYILSGEDQPVGTIFQIFSAIAETIGEPLFAKIDFEWDLERRRARVEIGNVVRAYSEPTRNPVTGEEHRMITVLPNGWIFREAENLFGFAKGRGVIKFNLFRRHSSLAKIFWRQDGLV
jgi:DNA-binding winged helix-turn-helix (wHTH) protein